MTGPLSQEWNVCLERRGRGGSPHLEVRQESVPAPSMRLSRVARLMALAIRWDGLVQSGAVKDYAELARLGRVSRARVSQILNLVHLAPDLQEQVLFLERPPCGRDPIHLARLQPIAALCDWKKQRRRWRELFGATSTSVELPPANRLSASRRRVPRSL
jgi:hypothetical protein